MTLLDYTTFDDIRATLGVNDVELTDETLGLALYSSNLAVELDDVSPDLSDRYIEVRDLPEGTRTKKQQRLFDVTRLFAAYTVGKQCCGSLPMFGPKTIGDSKTEVSRFTNDPYKETIKTVAKEWERHRQRTQTALADLQSTARVSVAVPAMLVSSPTSDPITGS
jgi:hypothetical protein